LIIGLWQYTGAAVSGGRAYLYSGKDGRLMKTYTCHVPGDTFGFDALGMGYIAVDGTLDFLITSAWSGIHGFHSGRRFLFPAALPPRIKKPARSRNLNLTPSPAIARIQIDLWPIITES